MQGIGKPRQPARLPTTTVRDRGCVLEHDPGILGLGKHGYDGVAIRLIAYQFYQYDLQTFLLPFFLVTRGSAARLTLDELFTHPFDRYPR